MTIQEALAKIKRSKITISSEALQMYEQDPDSFLHWLLEEEKVENTSKVQTLIKILNAVDWELDLIEDKIKVSKRKKNGNR